MVDVINLVGLGIATIMMIIIGIYGYHKAQKIKEYDEALDRRVKDIGVLDKANRDLTQHNQNLSNALNTNSKAMDDRKNEVLDMRLKVIDLERNLETEKKKYGNLIHQTKSSQVRVGLISEQIAPFLREWPYDPQQFRFLGSPIDGISFEDEELVVIEIKTGKAKLSPKQRQIKKQIKEGRVKFMEFRIEEDGYRCKTD